MRWKKAVFAVFGRLANEVLQASDQKTASLGNGWQGALRAGDAHADKTSKCQTG